MDLERIRIENELTRGILHDINNILTTIVGYSELLMKKTSEENKEQLELISKIAHDGMIVTRRAKNTFSPYNENNTIFDICKVINEVVIVTKPLYEEGKKEIKILFEYIKPIYIKGNESEFRESIINMILNSVDAIDNIGIIKIEIKELGEKVRVTIKDSGIGIEKEIINRIFDPFFTTKGSKGTGIGLYNVKKAVNSMGGTIEVSSEKGIGTVFILEFQKVESNQVNSEIINNVMNSTKQRILIIDDQIEICKVAKEMINSFTDADVDICTNSLKVLELIENKNYNLVITDISMPGLNGLELLEKIKRIKPDLKIVLMTGWGEGMNKSINADKAYVLYKPFTLEELKKCLLTW